MMRLCKAAWLMVGLAALGFVGCGPSGQQAEPNAAREALTRALDAWQKGDTLDSVKASSSITVVEPLWKEGAKLTQYEIQGEPKPSGFDMQFTVKLSLQDAKGPKEQKALYAVSTSPALVVVRSTE